MLLTMQTTNRPSSDRGGSVAGAPRKLSGCAKSCRGPSRPHLTAAANQLPDARQNARSPPATRSKHVGVRGAAASATRNGGSRRRLGGSFDDEHGHAVRLRLNFSMR